MATSSRQPERRNSPLSSLNMTVEVLNLAEEVSDVPPVKTVLGSASAILVMIRVWPLPIYLGEFQTHTCVGLDDESSRIC